MKQGKQAGYGKNDLDRLYALTESWTDIGGSLSGPDVPFEVDDLCVFYALPAKTASAVAHLARRRRTTPERLIKRWVEEKLASV